MPSRPAACLNVIASHPAVLSVAASDSYDEAEAGQHYGGSTCVDLFAPSGGMGVGAILAYPTNESGLKYRRVIAG